MLQRQSWKGKRSLGVLSIILKSRGSEARASALASLEEFITALGFPGGSDGKGFTCNAGDLGSVPGSGRSPGEGKGLLTPVLLPGEFHGQRSLVAYSPWGCKESDTTERLTHMHYCATTAMIMESLIFT